MYTDQLNLQRPNFQESIYSNTNDSNPYGILRNICQVGLGSTGVVAVSLIIDIAYKTFNSIPTTNALTHMSVTAGAAFIFTGCIWLLDNEFKIQYKPAAQILTNTNGRLNDPYRSMSDEQRKRHLHHQMTDQSDDINRSPIRQFGAQNQSGLSFWNEEREEDIKEIKKMVKEHLPEVRKVCQFVITQIEKTEEKLIKKKQGPLGSLRSKLRSKKAKEKDSEKLLSHQLKKILKLTESPTEMGSSSQSSLKA